MNGEGATRWSRNNDGNIVHRSDCRHGRIPWVWAESLTDDEIVAGVERAVWLRFGACCDPSVSRVRSVSAHPAGKGGK